MSRSVSRPSNYTAIVYLHQPFEDGGFGCFVEDLQQVLCDRFPSLSPCDRWLDREDRIILENRHAVVTVSEYRGLVAVCLVPEMESALNYESARIALSEAWCSQVEDSFVKHLHKAFASSALISDGSASNGEQFFHPVSRPEGVVTSKEGTLEMFG